MIRLSAGFELVYDCPQATPMLLVLNIHPSRTGDLLVPGALRSEPALPLGDYVDGFGNRCSRAVLPPGRTRLYSHAEVADSGLPDSMFPDAYQYEVQDLPDDTLVFLLGSRYCETDRLNEMAWSLFGGTPPGWARVQAICDYVHRNITFMITRST